MCPEENPRFIVDINVGKIAKWLRMTGYNALLFDHQDDKYLIHIAMTEKRIIITRDTQILKRRVIVNGNIKALLITNDNPLQQIQQVIKDLGLNPFFNPFTLCLECNEPLVKINKEDIEDRVPPYVYRTQSEFVECPACHRIYWQGTHWQAMLKKQKKLTNS
jgi:uncharacterized protein with PIN domain